MSFLAIVIFLRSYPYLLSISSYSTDEITNVANGALLVIPLVPDNLSLFCFNFLSIGKYLLPPVLLTISKFISSIWKIKSLNKDISPVVHLMKLNILLLFFNTYAIFMDISSDLIKCKNVFTPTLNVIY